MAPGETRAQTSSLSLTADFMESLAPLKTHRESQGFSVALIDVEDIYDEFSYGTKTPQAIKDFLTRASTSWQTPPRFVLLVGDASFDPRNYLGLGNQDFLPTKLLDTAYMETASDDWFVDFNGDGLPDMAVGRLPVQTAEEASDGCFQDHRLRPGTCRRLGNRGPDGGRSERQL